MTLVELAQITPGYVTMHIHTDKEAWTMNAGMVAAGEMPAEAHVISQTPISPYTMEVSIKFKEDYDENCPC